MDSHHSVWTVVINFFFFLVDYTDVPGGGAAMLRVFRMKVKLLNKKRCCSAELRSSDNKWLGI